LPAVAQVRYKPIDLGTLPGGNLSNAYGVNDQRRVVGVSKTGANFNHGLVWTKKAGMKDLGALGGNFSSAQAINNASQIVGQADTAAGSDAFLWTNGTMQDLGNLGNPHSQANAINFDVPTKSFTQIAGWSLTSDGSAYHAVIWDASNNILDLGTLGGTTSFAFGNNWRHEGPRHSGWQFRSSECHQ
jgi:probable HAF family extracellular repeat protein